MCGITGILSLTGAAIDPGALAAMRDAMAHRGPDGEGLYVCPGGFAGLGHRRLAIVDLDPRAGQPMGNEDGSVQVVFNGEIYNHLDLRRELTALGHVFATNHADTEVIVHGYEEWGAQVFERLIGMFGVGIWDERRGLLTLARDRVGIKPVYFSLLPGLFLFGSEIKAILAHPAAPRQVDRAALSHCLTFMTAPAPLTLFENIFKLPAGHVLEIDKKGSPRARRFWDALPGRGIDQAEIAGLSPAARRDFYIQGIRERLARSVKRRMMSDAPMGVFLSGGMDSTANLALMSGLSDRPVDAFTVGFSDHPEGNEIEYAQAAAAHFRANHHTVLISQADMTGYLDNLMFSQDEPIADWVCIPLYFVSRLAAERGVKVIQVGEGADELFCGYPGFLDYLRLGRTWWRVMRSLPAPLARTAAALADAVLGGDPGTAAVADAAWRAARDREFFWGGAVVFWETHKKRLLAPDYFSSVPPAFGAKALAGCGLLPPGILDRDSFAPIRAFRERFDAHAPGADALTRMTYFEFGQRLPELLLMRVDKITMSVALEARVPFLDHELAEFAFDIPMADKLGPGQTKHLLRQALRGIIPDRFIDRPKMGFSAPMRQWLQGDFGERARQMIATSPLFASCLAPGAADRLITIHRGGRRDMSAYIWTLCNLAAWHAHWIEGRSACV